MNPLFAPEEISAAVVRIAGEVTRDYRGRYPLLLGVLKGSFMFMADLVRYLNLSVEMEFITLSSYGADIETSGRVKIVRGLGTPVKGRDVVVVEDIVDTGETLSFLLKYLIRSKPASVKVCTLLDKVARRRVAVPIDYRGFVVPDAFVVGYGLDCGEQFRHLPGIYVLKGEDAG